MAIIISVILIAVIAFCIFIGINMFNLAINTVTSKKYFTEDLRIFKTDETEEEKKQKVKWLKDNSKEIYIKSLDKLKLCGYEIRNKKQSDTWIIAVHGYMGKGLDMVPCIQKFIEMGYNALIIDQRAHGNSQGKYRGMGYLECKDLKEWIKFITNKYKKSKIILYGVSMGATTVLMETGELLPENVKACIEDCAYTSIWDEFKCIYKKSFKLPTFPVLNIASIVSKIKAGYYFKQASAIKAVKKSKIPTIFIHGENDKLVPCNMMEKLYKVAKCKKEKLVVKNAGHIESCRVDTENYWKKIKEFISAYI